MRDPRVRLLTCNVNCNGPSKVQATLDLINNNLADLISLQEIDVHAFGAVAYTKEWRRAGCSLVLSSPEVGSQKHRVGLVSRLPIRPVLLPSTVSARAAAGLIQVSIQDALYPLLVVASYGYPGDQHATDALVDALVAFAKSFGGRFVLFGDWNATDDEGAIARHACEGSLNCLDSAFPFALPCTNPRRTRRIDFAVSDFRVSASEVSHIEGPWDHVSVCYTQTSRRVFGVLSCLSAPPCAHLTLALTMLGGQLAGHRKLLIELCSRMTWRWPGVSSLIRLSKPCRTLTPTPTTMLFLVLLPLSLVAILKSRTLGLLLLARSPAARKVCAACVTVWSNSPMIPAIRVYALTYRPLCVACAN